MLERRPLVFLEIEAEPAGGEAAVAVRLFPCDQRRQFERLDDCHAADLSRSHLGEHEVVVLQSPAKDGSRMTLGVVLFLSGARAASATLVVFFDWLYG